MNKTQLLNRYAKDNELRNVFASALDKMTQANDRQCLTASSFLSLEEQSDFELLLGQCGQGQWQMEGGFAQAERRVCLFLPPWMEECTQAEDIPLVAVEATPKGINQGQKPQIGHRDVLGSLMGLGLHRRKLGDIILTEEKIQVLALPELLPILLSQWTEVGRHHITLKEIPLSALDIPQQEVKEITSTVASLRLDSLLATGFSLSRSKAVGLISSGKVTVNQRECVKSDKVLEEGDWLRCRGLGKCQITQIKGQTKKDRTLVVIERYV